jgi:succinate-acetate transporter protein
MDIQPNKMLIKDTSANPAPLGLMAFGMTTVLLNLHNAGLFSLSTMILAMGIFYGGIAQIIVGVMEWKKGNTFGTVAFTSYGLFWLTLVGLLVMPGINMGAAADNGGMIAYFIIWGLFTLLMFVGTLKINRALQVVFGTLVILFSKVIGTITGYEGIVCGLSAIYASVAQIWNEVYGKEVLPLGAVKK